jgi:hypothetical protein
MRKGVISDKMLVAKTNSDGLKLDDVDDNDYIPFFLIAYAHSF